MSESAAIKTFILEETETAVNKEVIFSYTMQHCHQESPLTDERIVQQRYCFPERTN